MMQNMNKIQYGQYEVPQAEQCASFNVGQPASYKLPFEEYKNAMVRVLLRNDPSMLQYGNISGYLDFRSELAKFLSNSYSNLLSDESSVKNTEIVKPDELVITNGNTGAVHLLLSLFAQTGTTLFVEDPTYFLMVDSFKELSMNISPIKMEYDGIDIETLRLKMSQENQNKTCILYTIPFHHNPTGYNMSDKKKQMLIELLNEYPNLLVLSDEVYHLLSFDDDIISFPLCYYHRNIISMGSFSKIFCPALRLGWIQSMDKDIIKKISGCGQLDSSGNLNPLGCTVMHELIVGGELTNTIKQWKTFLNENFIKLYNSITTILADDIESVSIPSGGYFIWVKFKPYVDTVKLSTLMESYKIKFHHGNKFSHSKNCCQYMRLSFSWYSNESDCVIFANRLKHLIDENKSDVYYAENSSKINVLVQGHKGKLGSLIIKHLNENSGFSFFGPYNDSIDFTTLPSNLVIIDVSSPKGTTDLLMNLLEKKKYYPVVIGTTGDLPYSLINEYGKHAPIVVSSNFSYGIVQMKKIINVIDKSKWYPLMTESHHVHKKDSPSGTAKTLALTYGINYLPVESIQSIRQGEIIGEHTLLLDSQTEYIEISHKAKTRELFASGSLNWIKWVNMKSNGVYNSMDD